jgi:hypothetical protein
MPSHAFFLYKFSKIQRLEEEVGGVGVGDHSLAATCPREVPSMTLRGRRPVGKGRMKDVGFGSATFGKAGKMGIRA